MTKNKIFKWIQIISIFASAFMLSRYSHAFLTINETAEILPENYYRLGVAPQLIVSDGGGFNVGVYADAHIIDDLDGRITMGGGETDFWTQASVKWVPFPDVEKQPAMGGRAAIIYARDEDHNLTGVQLTPLFSKKADTRYGNMIPYAGLPITWFSGNSSYVSSQFTVGAEWFPTEDKHIGAEFNLNLDNSLSSVSVYFSFPFEGSTGYKKY
ncbi:hypothetical protein [Pseudobdellovibrio sp. HCB154]|uniref:hypothetical protein n=1 Tax=Pseudobdellovibrio sp. HCB154 TaxID=3386277 RepID=UPI003916F658